MAAPDLLDERDAVPEGIGATLRGAREAAGYSVADVAERMRLSHHLVENLEAERFDLFPVSVFLRGYLTSYARLLELDPGPVLKAYDRRGFGPPQIHSQDSARSTNRGSEFTVTITTIVVIAVLIILSALWWREQWVRDAGLPGVTVERPGEEGPAGAMDAGPGEPMEPVAPTDLPERPEVVGEPAPKPPLDPETAADGRLAEPSTVRADATSPAGDDAPSAEEPEAPAPVARGEIEEGEQGPAGASPIPTEAAATPAEPPSTADPDVEEPVGGIGDAGAESESAPAPAAAQDGAAPDPAASTPAGPDGLATLVVRVREDCWLMIRDADERLVYRDLASAGTVLELSIAPPIQVVAGYAEGIELEYDGEVIDLSPWVEPDTGTARFRLGP